MIVRIILGLAAVAIAAMVRRRRRSRRPAASVPTLTVRTGYHGLENVLYRVTIERGRGGGAQTFSWSRDGERERGAVRCGIPVERGTWTPLENGIDIRFDDGAAFAPGDFWTFPARSAADTVTLKARPRGTKRSARRIER